MKTGLRLDLLYPVAQLVSELTKIPVARNKPITGDNEFTCESGMVAYCIDKFAKNNMPSQAYNPTLIGRNGYDIILGKMSGAYSVAMKLKEAGIEATKDQVAEITELVKAEGSMRKWSLTQNDLKTIANAYFAKQLITK
jgi:isopropylmalate/homocitrate/citramalate synthase